jgi:ribonuclease BN (tRNA processing enzyme)
MSDTVPPPTKSTVSEPRAGSSSIPRVASIQKTSINSNLKIGLGKGLGMGSPFAADSFSVKEQHRNTLDLEDSSAPDSLRRAVTAELAAQYHRNAPRYKRLDGFGHWGTGMEVKLLRMAVAVLALGVAPTCAVAVPTQMARAAVSAARPGARTRLILLGTAGGPPIRLQRAEPSNLVVVDGTPYLIDAGVGSLRNLVASGFNPASLRAILITHHHLDHDGGLSDVIEYSSFNQRATPVDVIGPFGTQAMVHDAIDLFSAARRTFGSEGLSRMPDPARIFAGHDIHGPGVVFQDDHIIVRAVENSHYQLFKPGSPSQGVDKSYAYRVETPDRVIVFTGDTGPSEAVTELAKGADILVSEVIDVPATVKFVFANVPNSKSRSSALKAHMESEHLTPEEVGLLASRAHVKMVVLTHFSPGADNEKGVNRYVDGVRKNYRGPVVAGKDLDQF